MLVHVAPGAGIAADVLSGVIEVLLAGRFVIAPTDTVYGLFCDALNPDAVAAVSHAKGRDPARAMPLAVSGLDGALRVAASIPGSARVLIERFWPGPLTLLLPARPGLPPQIVSDGRVGVREHDHPLVRALVAASGRPLVATSANLTGGPEPTSLDLIDPSLRLQAAFVFDQGPLPAGRPSTVVDATTDPPRIIREGIISGDRLL